MKFKVIDSMTEEYWYEDIDSLLRMLNNQFDLMKFEVVE